MAHCCTPSCCHGPLIPPTVADFKAYFNRDFPYGDSLEQVQDADIEKALNMASFTINYSLFGKEDKFKVCYLLLSAHYLVTNLTASSQGLAGQYSWLTQSKSVGSVSEGIAIPPRILENPELAMIAKTTYGAQYIMFILPLLTGVVYTVHGRTLP